MKRIGIFSGTFDPVHEGHIAFALSALDRGLEKVMFLVEPRPRRKQGVRSLEHRQAMVDLAIATQPYFGTIILERARLTPHETLPILQSRFTGAELVLLFGDDVITYMADHIAQWPHIEQLAEATSLMIAARQHNQADVQANFAILKRDHGLRFRYEFIEPHYQHISSSAIRQALRQHQPAVGLDPTVAAYIKKHRLYVSSAAAK